MSFPYKRDDRPPADDDGDDTAIAIELETLGEIEAALLAMTDFAAEARQANREAKGLTTSPRMNRLLNRAIRANDDVIKRGLAVIERARSL